jgi:hypothetical protein
MANNNTCDRWPAENNPTAEAIGSTDNSPFERLATGTGKRREFLLLLSGAALAGVGALVACNDVVSGPTGATPPRVRDAGLANSSSSCVTSITPQRNNFPVFGGTGSFAVTAPTGCSWTAQSQCPTWIRITSGASGTGSGTVDYRVRSNPTDHQRRCAIVVDGVSHTVSQD